MINMFGAEKLKIQLSDGRLIFLEDLVNDYEKLLKEAVSIKVGEWFFIDREVIDQNKEEICHKCYELGDKGIELWKRFAKSNEIANNNPDQYPRVIKTYIFPYNWKYKTEQEMRDMCEEFGDGMCDEVICDLELQMRICNGECVADLVQKADRLPCIRVIKLRNGGTGFFGGGADNNFDYPPTEICYRKFIPENYHYNHVPYAFCTRVFL